MLQDRDQDLKCQDQDQDRIISVSSGLEDYKTAERLTETDNFDRGDGGLQRSAQLVGSSRVTHRSPADRRVGQRLRLLGRPRQQSDITRQRSASQPAAAAGPAKGLCSRLTLTSVGKMCSTPSLLLFIII